MNIILTQIYILGYNLEVKVNANHDLSDNDEEKSEEEVIKPYLVKNLNNR